MGVVVLPAERSLSISALLLLVTTFYRVTLMRLISDSLNRLCGEIYTRGCAYYAYTFSTISRGLRTARFCVIRLRTKQRIRRQREAVWGGASILRTFFRNPLAPSLKRGDYWTIVRRLTRFRRSDRSLLARVTVLFAFLSLFLSLLIFYCFFRRVEICFESHVIYIYVYIYNVPLERSLSLT